MVTSTPTFSPGRNVTRSGATATFGIPFIVATSRLSTLGHDVGGVHVGPAGLVDEVVMHLHDELRSLLADPDGLDDEAGVVRRVQHAAGQRRRRRAPVAERGALSPDV